MPLEYGGTVRPGVEDCGTDVKSGGGSEIISEKELANIQKYEASLPPESTADEEQHEGNDSESDADDCEEWERHEAFQNDPSNQERNKERLYESEMEIVWEKGGPGIVWYTDAQFWEELEGRKLSVTDTNNNINNINNNNNNEMHGPINKTAMRFLSDLGPKIAAV